MWSKLPDDRYISEKVWTKMIIDGFIFNNELDILEMRLYELYPVVDKFIVVQSYQTFRGDNKDVHFHKDHERWAKYRNKIDTVSIGMTGVQGDAWAKEQFQRNYIGIAAGAWATDDDDVLIVSDVDEIPKREVVAELENKILPAALCMDMYYYSLNIRKGGWAGAKAIRVGDLSTAQELRHSDVDGIQEAGWHYSYLGDDKFISDKLKAFSHSELDTPEVHANISNNRSLLLDPYNHKEQLVREELDLNNVPHIVRDNYDYWRRYVD